MERKLSWTVGLAACLGVALAGVPAKLALAHGGGHGGGGHHGGGHHAGHHGGHHPYHPSSHHTSHHSHHHAGHHDHHHDHYHHHHHSWHHGGWGWGLAGLGLGYGLGGGWNNWGWGGGAGDTYVNNSYPVSTDANTTDSPMNGNVNAQQNAGDQPNSNQPNANDRFPVDVWPELGVNTYSGQYGKLQGVVIVTVQPGSAAAKAGLVPGDVIQQLNGQPVANTDELEKILDTAKGEFTTQVWDARTGRTSTLSGKLDQNTEQPAEQDAPSKG